MSSERARQIIALLLCVCLMGGLCACSSGTGSEDAAGTEEADETAAYEAALAALLAIYDPDTGEIDINATQSALDAAKELILEAAEEDQAALLEIYYAALEEYKKLSAAREALYSLYGAENGQISASATAEALEQVREYIMALSGSTRVSLYYTYTLAVAAYRQSLAEAEEEAEEETEEETDDATEEDDSLIAADSGSSAETTAATTAAASAGSSTASTSQSTTTSSSSAAAASSSSASAATTAAAETTAAETTAAETTAAAETETSTAEAEEETETAKETEEETEEETTEEETEHAHSYEITYTDLRLGIFCADCGTNLTLAGISLSEHALLNSCSASGTTSGQYVYSTTYTCSCGDTYTIYASE